jgi:peptidoglycan hydrolase CwlO-like protein
MLLATLAGTAGASPKEQIAAKRREAVAAKAKIDALSMQLEPAIERWNAATEELRGVRVRIAANKRRLGVVDVSIDRSRELLADRLREEYRAGNPDPLGTVLASGSITDMLATADLLKRSERQTADLLTTLQTDERELEDVGRSSPPTSGARRSSSVGRRPRRPRSRTASPSRNGSAAGWRRRSSGSSPRRRGARRG